MKTIVENILIEGLYSVVVLEYFRTFYEKKNIRGILFYIWGISLTGQIVENDILINFPSYIKTFTSILSLVIFSCFFVGSIGGKIVFAVLYGAIGTLCEILIGIIFVSQGISVERNANIGLLLADISVLILVKVLQCFFHDTVIRQLSWKTSVKLMLLPIGSLFLAYYVFNTEYALAGTSFNATSFLCIGIIFVINFVVFHLYIQLSENLELKRRTSVYEKEFLLLDQHIKEKENVMQEFRRRRHDLKHQMSGLLRLLEQKQYGLLESSLKELAELQGLEGFTIANTDNSIVNTLVNYKYETAKSQGIDFRVHLDIPDRLPFADGDLCVVLGNALDNAIEANLRGTVRNPYVNLKMSYDGDVLIIIIENAFDGKIKEGKKGERLTRKPDCDNHGIGISSMKSVVKKYYGFYDVKINDNIYKLNLLLYGAKNGLKRD